MVSTLHRQHLSRGYKVRIFVLSGQLASLISASPPSLIFYYSCFRNPNFHQLTLWLFLDCKTLLNIDHMHYLILSSIKSGKSGIIISALQMEMRFRKIKCRSRCLAQGWRCLHPILECLGCSFGSSIQSILLLIHILEGWWLIHKYLGLCHPCGDLEGVPASWLLLVQPWLPQAFGVDQQVDVSSSPLLCPLLFYALLSSRLLSSLSSPPLLCYLLSSALLHSPLISPALFFPSFFLSLSLWFSSKN